MSHSAEKDAVQVAVRPRRAGKTTEAVEWVMAGEPTDSYPFWTRVLLTPTIEAADQARRQFPALDYRQVFAWSEWRSARLGARPVEVALDNADILIAQTIGQVARFVTITGRVTPPGGCPACGKPLYTSRHWNEWVCSDPECTHAHGPGPGGGNPNPPGTPF